MSSVDKVLKTLGAGESPDIQYIDKTKIKQKNNRKKKKNKKTKNGI